MTSWVLVAVLAASQPAVEVVTLENGMRWVLLARADQGRVSGVVMVNAGGRHEREGETGTAHLLEHLAFAGTPIVGSVRGWRVEAPVQEQAEALTDELAALISSGEGNGPRARELITALVAVDRDWRELGDARAFQNLFIRHDVRSNAWTNKDTTAYWADFPREQVRLWLAAEAQRFAAPVFREFRTERDVVIQELRDRQMVASHGLDALWRLAFNEGYAWPTAGWEGDLRGMSPRSLSRFYAQHYAPNNAVGCLVGEFDAGEAKRWLAETFAHIPARETAVTREDSFTQPRTRQVPASEAWLLIGFASPGAMAADAPRVEVLRELLDAGEGPLRVLRANSGDAVLGASVSAGPGAVAPHLTLVTMRLRSNGDAGRAKQALFEVLAKWAPSEDDLVRAKASLEKKRLVARRTRRGLAEALALQTLLGQRWEAVFEPRYATVSADEVVKVVRGFTPERAWIVEMVTP
jgi:predicted Zn-dependent peptidase